jgi:hypothetical protein
MKEKKALKASELQKIKEVDALHASVKRSSTLRSEISQCLAERNELEAEVADMGSQVRRPSITFPLDYLLPYLLLNTSCILYR